MSDLSFLTVDDWGEFAETFPQANSWFIARSLQRQIEHYQERRRRGTITPTMAHWLEQAEQIKGLQPQA